MVASPSAASARRAACSSPARPPAAIARAAASAGVAPAVMRLPSSSSSSSATTLSAVRPQATECEPHELLPTMPPSVQRLWVDGSGPTSRPWAAAARRRSSRTRPGSTRARRRSGSSSTIRFRCREQSTTTPRPTACPPMLVPPPRKVSGTPAWRQTASVASTSAVSRGKATPSGTQRYSDASLEYSARRPSPKSTSPPTAARSAAASSSPWRSRGISPPASCPPGLLSSKIVPGGGRTVRLGSVVSGESARPAESRVLHSRNPAKLGEVVAELELADDATFRRACRAARDGQPAWAALRGRVVQQVGRLVEANKQALAELVTREIGKPLRESLGEVQEVIDTCTFFLGEGRRLYGQTVPSEMPDKQLFTFRRPLGVVAVITAANFPVAVPSWYLVPALLCGNTVVWKPSEQAGAAARALAELLWHGGVPADALHLVQADGQTAFEGLELALEDGLVDKLGFTGSTAVGRRLGELCGRHLQSPCLELGGKNPLVVAPDADLDLAVEGALFSGFGTAGQRCTSLGTAIVHERVYDDFLERFDRAVSSAPLGDPFQDVLYGPLLGEPYLERFEGFLGMIAGHHKRYGSTGVGRITAANPRQGFVGVAAYGSPDEAVALANGHGYGLSAAIYTRDPRTAFQFAEHCAAGMVSVNNSTSGAEAHLPFGGNGLSGNGSRQSGIWVLEQFTSWQALNWDYSGKLQKAQMDVAEPPSDPDFRLDR